MRLDKYLKVSRLIKRRELAKEFIERGFVTLNYKSAKPASEVKIGDIIEIKNANSSLVIKARVVDIKNVTKAVDAEKLYELLED